MINNDKIVIVVETAIEKNVEIVWKLWTSPEDITKWNSASEDWHTPWAENDLRAGGQFKYRMESKDGKMGFDFYGIYEFVKPSELIEYVIGDGRRVKIEFIVNNSSTKIIESFEAESTNSIELQRSGWQSILDNFKKHVEEFK